MEVFWIVFSQMVSLLLLTAAGFVIGKLGVVNNTKQISAILSRLCIPALIINTLQAPYSAALLRNIGGAAVGMTVITLVSMAVGYLLALLLRRGRKPAWIWSVSVGFTNTVFMGRPVMIALYGDAVDPMTAGITLMFNLLCFSFGALAMSRSVENPQRRVSVRQILLSPIMLSCVVGFILFLMPFRLPVPVLSAVNSLGGATTPLSMVLLGIELSFVSMKKILVNAPAWVAAMGRLLLSPVACWAVLRLFISDPVLLGMLCIGAAMPIASTVALLATEYDGDIAFVTTTTTITNLCCAITAPLVLSLLIR